MALFDRGQELVEAKAKIKVLEQELFSLQQDHAAVLLQIGLKNALADRRLSRHIEADAKDNELIAEVLAYVKAIATGPQTGGRTSLSATKEN